MLATSVTSDTRCREVVVIFQLFTVALIHGIIRGIVSNAVVISTSVG
jgi:hypothetical protein